MLSRRIKRKVAERFPKNDGSTRGLVWYGISRSTMIRRWRFPKLEVAARRRRLKGPRPPPFAGSGGP